jgi:hypothetical protein
MELILGINQNCHKLPPPPLFFSFGPEGCELTLYGYNDHFVCMFYPVDKSVCHEHLRVDDGALFSE